MFRMTAAETSELLGAWLSLVVSMGLFFLSPLTPVINRWVELALCLACVMVGGWFTQALRNAKARFYETLLLATGICALPYLIHTMSSPDATDQHAVMSILTLLLVIGIFIALAMHLGCLARQYYSSMKHQDWKR